METSENSVRIQIFLIGLINSFCLPESIRISTTVITLKLQNIVLTELQTEAN